MSQQTMRCRNGCREDYLEREYLEEPTSKRNVYTMVTFYYCNRCSWRAEWRPGAGLQVLDDGGLDTTDLVS